MIRVIQCGNCKSMWAYDEDFWPEGGSATAFAYAEHMSEAHTAATTVAWLPPTAFTVRKDGGRGGLEPSDLLSERAPGGGPLEVTAAGPDGKHVVRAILPAGANPAALVQVTCGPRPAAPLPMTPPGTYLVVVAKPDLLRFAAVLVRELTAEGVEL